MYRVEVRTLEMNGTISGHLIDVTTGEIASSSEISLVRAGVLGESFTQADRHGRFAFSSLPSGKYCLGIHDDRYAPLYHNLILEEGETIENLQIALTPAAFIRGRILDEEGQPPQRCVVTLIRAGIRKGRSGYISDSGDHKVAQDGHFSSPPLHPGRYFLGFLGILRTLSTSTSSQSTHGAMQQRIFDFLYPNAEEIKDARPFDLQTGKTMNYLEVRIPHPIWRTVRGKVTGTLPEDLANIHVRFTRDVGMLDDFDGGGAKVNSDGTFEGLAQPGRYRLSVWELAPPQPNEYTKMARQFASVEVIVGHRDIDVTVVCAPPLAAQGISVPCEPAAATLRLLETVPPLRDTCVPYERRVGALRTLAQRFPDDFFIQIAYQDSFRQRRRADEYDRALDMYRKRPL